MLHEQKIERLLGRLLPKTWFYLKNTMEPGMPDRLIVAPDGATYWVELKAPNGKLSIIQKYKIKKLKDLGHDVRVLYNENEVKRFVEEVIL